jgi:hypothetical protein
MKPISKAARRTRKKRQSWWAWVKKHVTWTRAVDLARLLMPLILEEMRRK